MASTNIYTTRKSRDGSSALQQSGSGVSPLKSRDGSSTLQQGGSGVSPLKSRDGSSTLQQSGSGVSPLAKSRDGSSTLQQSGSGVSPLKKSRDGSSTLDNLCAAIIPLVAQLAAVQKQAKALGLFTNDRELLECPHCGLMENVTINGLLITCREPNLSQDTGLRFKKVKKQTFRCPSCKGLVTEPPVEDFDFSDDQLEART